MTARHCSHRRVRRGPAVGFVVALVVLAGCAGVRAGAAVAAADAMDRPVRPVSCEVEDPPRR